MPLRVAEDSIAARAMMAAVVCTVLPELQRTIASLRWRPVSLTRQEQNKRSAVCRPEVYLTVSHDSQTSAAEGARATLCSGRGELPATPRGRAPRQRAAYMRAQSSQANIAAIPQCYRAGVPGLSHPERVLVMRWLLAQPSLFGSSVRFVLFVRAGHRFCLTYPSADCASDCLQTVRYARAAESVKIILQGVPLYQQSRGRPKGPQSTLAAHFEGKLTCVAAKSCENDSR